MTLVSVGARPVMATVGAWTLKGGGGAAEAVVAGAAPVLVVVNSWDSIALVFRHTGDWGCHVLHCSPTICESPRQAGS